MGLTTGFACCWLIMTLCESVFTAHAERGNAMANRLSVCDAEILWSYTLRSKTITLIVKLGSSLSVAPNIINLVQEEHPQILGGGI